MGKFVARTFVPGEIVGMKSYAFDTAWEAWESLLIDRLDAEAKAAGVPSAEYVYKLYSSAGDMNELAQPGAYDDNGAFGVKSVGLDWLGSNGCGVIWAPTAVDPMWRGRSDKGICYQVSWEETYVGL